MSKEFKQAAGSAKPVYQTIIGSAQGRKNGEEAKEAQGSEGSTQGKKGKRSPRINMAFSQENLDYLRVMASLGGESMTTYVNRLIEADREKHKSTYHQAKLLTTTSFGPT